MKDNINPMMQQSISKIENIKDKVCYALLLFLFRINESNEKDSEIM